MKRFPVLLALLSLALLSGCDNPLAFLSQPASTATPAPLSIAAAGGVPTPAAAANTLNPTEQQVFDLLNQQRTNGGLQPTTLDPSLTALARARSQDMADRNYFAHVNPDGKSLFDFLKQQGITYHRAGEIIAEDNYPQAQTAATTVTGWMNSQEHHDIIMTPEYTLVGVGEAVKGEEHIYTAIYLRP